MVIGLKYNLLYLLYNSTEDPIDMILLKCGNKQTALFNYAFFGMDSNWQR
jgi:hypothetical protein